MLVPNARLVRDDLLGHVLDVNAQFFVGPIRISEGSGNLFAVGVHLVDRLVELVVVLVLLLSETAQPNVALVLVVCYDVRVFISQVLLAELH